MIFTNGRLVCAEEMRDTLEIVVHNGRIAEIRPFAKPAPESAIDLVGNFLAPGFIDLHLHGANGCDSMDATAEAFRAIAAYHASGGTTSMLLTTATAPLEKILHVLALVRAAKIPQIVGVHVEGPFISRAKAGAQNPQFIRAPDNDSLGALLKFSDVIKRITLAPEIPGALAAIERFREAKIIVSGGHSDAWEEDARRGFERGMHSTTHTFNCMSSARRRGAERVAGLLEFALSEPEIACELVADGRHVSTTLMKMLYRAKGARGIFLSTDATAGAGLPAGAHFDLAGNDCVVADGACWLADRTALAGSSARMIDLVRTMVREVGVPLPAAIAMATANPARLLGLTNTGILAVGAPADFVVLSPELEVVQTFVAGERAWP
ncbi:MAG: N-acetylglucosamine-6-phosphate deacetylase [Chthoniobacterales bacterium]